MCIFNTQIPAKKSQDAASWSSKHGAEIVCCYGVFQWVKGAQDIRRFRLLLRNMICIDLRGFFKKPSKSFKRSGNVQDCWMRFLCSSRHWWLWFKLIIVMMVRLCWTVRLQFPRSLICRHALSPDLTGANTAEASGVTQQTTNANSNFTGWFCVARNAELLQAHHPLPAQPPSPEQPHHGGSPGHGLLRQI